ncbi:MAG: hypothetical protein NTV34_02740 [Proteobacteria bacterium]|nr:hypothetical protein [Pseudomonadota bacterium]
MKFLVMYFSLCASTALADGYEIFESSVYPILRQNCALCHDAGQRPYHSNGDSKVAYLQAKTVLNHGDASASLLWNKSFSNHCGIPERCGIQRPELLDGITRWAAAEGSNPADQFSFASEVTIDIPSIDQPPLNFIFRGVAGESYQFSISRFDADTVIVYEPKAKGFQNYMSLSGFEIRSKDIAALHQNFSEYKLVARGPGDELLSLTDNSSGYIFFRLGSQNQSTANLQFWTKELTFDLGRADAKSLYQKGFHVLRQQYEYYVNALYSSAGGHRCAKFNDNRVKCWGENSYGELGLGSTSFSVGISLGQMGPNLDFSKIGKNVTKLTFGEGFSCALFNDGKVKCWGFGGTGALGAGNSLDRGKTPEGMNSLPYLDLGKLKVIDISSTYQHVCALFENSKIKCWGDNSFGQLGYGDSVWRGTAPGQMGENLKFVDLGDMTVKKVTATYRHTCALGTNSKVKCWGDGISLGLGTTKPVGKSISDMGNKLPYVDLGPGKIVDLQSGGLGNCVIFEGGKIKCWGGNSDGDLGLGDNRSRGAAPNQMGTNLPYVDILCRIARS